MMVLSALRPDASLTEYLAHRARSSAVIRLAADLVAAASITGAALWWSPPAQLLIVTAGICFGAYGAWGLLDRARSVTVVHGWERFAKVLYGACAAVFALGVVAGVGVLLAAWALALGTWIS